MRPVQVECDLLFLLALLCISMILHGVTGKRCILSCTWWQDKTVTPMQPHSCTYTAGHLYSCAADLRPYLPRLLGTARSWLLQQLQDVVTLPVAGSEAQLRRRISALQVGWSFGGPQKLGGGLQNSSGPLPVDNKYIFGILSSIPVDCTLVG